MTMCEARRGRRVPRRALPAGIESEVYVTVPGGEIAGGASAGLAVDAAHEEVSATPPERDYRWFSDACVLTGYGIATVNYGRRAASPVPSGENVHIDGSSHGRGVCAAGCGGSA